MATTKIILKTSGLSKNYEETSVLENIDIQLHEGEWLGILGESGSGKSTLLRILGRFIDQDSGSVHFGKTELTPVKNELIPGHDRIKLIHQEYELFPNQTVEENISYALRFYDPEYKTEKVNELLEMTALGYVKGKKAKLLSGGEKQRTAIARSLAEEPAVLLLDEPFAHLDLHNKRVLADAIEALQVQKKTACVFVTHESKDALAWSDKIAVLRKGKIIQIGTPQELYDFPANSYVAELTGDINWLGKEGGKQYFIRPEKIKRTKFVEKSKWQGKVSAVRFHGNHWEIRCANDEGILSFYRNRNDLAIGEDIYLTYTKKDLRVIS